MTSSKNPLSARQRAGFTIIMLLIPLLIVLAAELLLRAVGYGDDYPLVRKRVIFGKEKYAVNRQVGRRYFSLPENLTPEPAEETFDFHKKPNGIRIFCVGGSTTAGFPYEINATFPFQLQFRLRDALLDNYVEVINLGISAVNSYTVLDLMPEILELQPDLIIIYMGHNEFYGALGAGSTYNFLGSRTLVLAYLKLKRFRLFQLIENAILAARSYFGASSAGKAGTLMQAMSGGRAIPLNSATFNRACENFEENLSGIVRMARERGVMVVTANLVSNLSDQPPFISGGSPQTDAFTGDRLQALLLEGRALLESGKPQEALLPLQRALQLDSLSADAHFYLGRALQADGDSADAYVQLTRARDLDELRFRAPSVFNDIIARVSREQDVPMVDLLKVFRAGSPGGIPGRNLFLEHLHPNFDGYRLMAQAFFQALFNLQFNHPLQPIGYHPALLGDAAVRKVIHTAPKDSAGVTALDLEFGGIRHFMLTHQWPFSEDNEADFRFYRPLRDAATRDVALKRLREKLPWERAHFELASYYAGQRRYRAAIGEYRAVNLAFYDNPLPFMKIGDLFMLQQLYIQAARYYEWGANADPHNAEFPAKQGNALVLSKHFRRAIEAMEKARQLDTQQPLLDKNQKLALHYYLAVSYANLRKWPEAQEALGRALQMQPDFAPALNLKGQIERFRSKEKSN